MDQQSFSKYSRRDFIRQAACAAVGTAAMTSAIRDLRFMNAAVAQSNISDYKALVCIFLAGGNDSNNLIIPTIQSEYDNYATLRGANLAIPLSGAPFNILPIAPLNSDGHEYGLHPACPELVTLFGEGNLAPVFNVGTLIHPLTRTSYSNTANRPPQLFSHADQVTQWQTSIPDATPLTGWGGRCADLLNSVQPNAPISLSVTLAGANTFEVGNIVSQYSVSTGGAIAMQSVSGNRLNSLSNILGLPYPNLQTKAYADVAEHAINTGSLLNSAIGTTSAAGYFNPQFPGTITQPTQGNTFGSSLGPQLRMIARLIEAGHRSLAAGGFGMKRQIFFCSVGGYDLHTNQTLGSSNTQVVQGAHANLFAELSQCMFAFQRAMETIGVNHADPNFAQRVTAFTSSDFGRTFPTNGLGSDHGWGSHHFVMGGAVRGQRTYGRFPVLTINGPDDTSTGRWIPSTACDQFFATIASWFGVDNNNLGTVFPNLGRFSSSNLGFI
jgi:uncharacterized protein (DUF1501 family)